MLQCWSAVAGRSVAWSISSFIICNFEHKQPASLSALPPFFLFFLSSLVQLLYKTSLYVHLYVDPLFSFFLSFTIQSWSIQFTSNLIEFNEFSINEIIWGRGGGQVVSRSGSETRYPRFNRSGFHFFKKSAFCTISAHPEKELRKKMTWAMLL